MARRTLSAGLAAAMLFPAMAAAQDEQAPPDPVGAAITGLIEHHRQAADPDSPYDALFPPRTSLHEFEETAQGLRLVFTSHLGTRVWTPEQQEELMAELREALADEILPADTIEVEVLYGTVRGEEVTHPFDEYVLSPERIRARQQETQRETVTLAHAVRQRADYPGPEITGGLQNRHLVIAGAHGMTWHEENRWQFQRARLYTQIEDLFPAHMVNNYLIPMLENAGGTVFSARERDRQTGEVIVDNDGVSPRSEFRTSGEWELSGLPGWNGPRPAVLGPEEEPFTKGTTLMATVPEDDGAHSEAIYVPYIPHQGRYAVYASWAAAETNSPSVPIRVHHLGGTTTVRVNQQVAGNTWVFLGYFEFEQGTDEERGAVVVGTDGAVLRDDDEPTTVSADAIRFGGGMANVAPLDQVSGLPRHMMAARYFLQYAGAPAREVFYHDFTNVRFSPDYWRDITARTEWANYLSGAPNAPNNFSNHPGLGVPIDLYLAWHTDAGVDLDGLIGTLSIWRLRGQDGRDVFPDGRTRMLNRDLASLIHHEIVRTGRENFTSSWAMRDLREANYGENRRPNVPSVLLELLSHQNFNDMKYGLDPRFQKDISRAIYKAMLRFLAASHDYEPIFLPLEPLDLAVRHAGDGTAELTWTPQSDPLEPTAEPAGYIVYHGTDGRSFDNGRLVSEPQASIPALEEGVTHNFRVTAVNEGGESFPTPIVGMRWRDGAEPVLIVDGFERVSTAAIVDEEGARGFDRNTDPGVPWHYNDHLVGAQYNFDPASDWQNDLEEPGAGASRDDHTGRSERGNTFDHITIHGEALAEADMAFDSTTLGGFPDAMDQADYPLVNWIAGLQRTTMPPAGMHNQGRPDRMDPEFEVINAENRAILEEYLDGGGKLLLSGAYIIEDLTSSEIAGEQSQRFATEVLGVEFFRAGSTTINAVRNSGEVEELADLIAFRFGNDLEPPRNILPTVYTVPSAESFIAAAEVNARSPLEYGDTGLDAAVLTDSVALYGFPLETVLPPEARTQWIAGSARLLLGMPVDWNEEE